jgi:enamine deaminase RidA (YjgF/YER057c/UK114 family)
MRLLQPPDWAKPRGYSNGIAAQGQLVFVAGMIGWNKDCVFETDDFAQQVRQALENIVAVLREADAGPEHVVRLTWYITDKLEYHANLPKLGEAYRSVMRKHYPVMSVLEVTALMEDRAKVEIEATAVIPRSASHEC